MKKRHIALFIGAALVLSNAGPMQAKSFEGKESEMNAKCSAIYDSATQEECRQYKEYLQAKSKDLDNEIKDIKSQIASVKGNMEKVTALISKNDQKIASYEAEISSIQTTIDKTQTSINKLKTQIKEKQEDIKTRDEQMRARILEMQPYIGSNNYIDFLMGSSSFTDLLRRSEIVGELNAYENDQIKILNKEKKKLDEDKAIVEEQKELLEVQKKDIKANKEKVEALNEAKKTLLENYHQEEATLSTQKREAQMAQMSLPKIDLSIAASFDEPVEQPKKEEPKNEGNSGSNSDNGNQGNTDNGNSGSGGSDSGNSGNTDSGGSDSGSGGSNSGNSGSGGSDSGNSGNGGSSGGSDSGSSGNGGSSGGSSGSTSFITPLQTGWHYEAGTWAYPGGGGHMGMDFSTGNTTGIPVVAPADGIILHTYSGCGNGYSSCGVPIGGGNNVLLLTKKGNTIYAMPFYHLNSVAVSVGSKVSQGQVLGYSGNSGWSTGPHCHVEIIRVGNMTMSQALAQYNSTSDLTFGTGWNANAPNACGSAPCRERPESYWQ